MFIITKSKNFQNVNADVIYSIAEFKTRVFKVLLKYCCRKVISGSTHPLSWIGDSS